MLKTLAKDVEAGTVVIKVTGWRIKNNERRPDSWQVKTRDGKLFMRDAYGKWSYLVVKEPTRRSVWGGANHWRVCGIRQREILAEVFFYADKNNLIKDDVHGKE